MSIELKTGILVVGGGPAGATAARRLAQLGHAVCLVEREAFPRARVGESLSPGIVPLLDVLGVRERIEEAAFYRPRRAFVRWASREILTKEFGSEAGFQVERGRFDEILLEEARAAGVNLLQPAAASSRPIRSENGQWRVPVNSAKGDLQIVANFLVDAAGRRCSVIGGKKKKLSPTTLALFAYWRRVKIGGTESRVEAGEQEWFWGAPLPNGTMNATVFLDPERFRRERVKTQGLNGFYLSLIKKSELLRVCLKGELASLVQICDATAYASERFASRFWIKVGEAGYAIDPLSSQGVQAAMRSGLQAAIVAHTILTKPENGDAAIKFYEDRQKETAFYHSRQAIGFYAEAAAQYSSDFWSKRKTSKIKPAKLAANSVVSRPISERVRGKLSPETHIVSVPCINGNIVEEMLALTHPSFENPVAFINEIPVHTLLDFLCAEKVIAETAKESTAVFERKNILKGLRWLADRNVLVKNGQVVARTIY